MCFQSQFSLRPDRRDTPRGCQGPTQIATGGEIKRNRFISALLAVFSWHSFIFYSQNTGFLSDPTVSPPPKSILFQLH